MNLKLTNIYFAYFVNSLIFLLLSFLLFLFDVNNIIQLLPCALFLLITLFFFSKFIIKNNIFLIFPWAIFIASSFIFFGSIGSFLRYDVAASDVILNVTIG